MRIKHLPLVLLIMILFLFSCELGDDDGDNNGGGFSPAPQFHTFLAIDATAADPSNTFYSVQAELLYEGDMVNIWAEITSNINRNTARNIANTYDTAIYPRMLSAFDAGIGFIDERGDIVANNLMELADYFVGGDGKLTILLLDIKNDFGADENNAFIAGYFWPGDLLQIPNSNRKAMIYIDANIGRQGGLTGVYNTIAHEMQHMMNFVFAAGVRGSLTDIWIDEGLSESAAWVWSQTHNQGRINYFNDDRLGTIARGNNFFVWDNHTSGNPAAVLDDYATAYLFFQWLRLQTGGTDIYRNILNSQQFHDHRAVTTAVNRSPATAGLGYNDWGTLLKTWLAANYINASSGPYGYLDDPVLRHVRANYLTGSAGSHSLYPGEGVFTRRTSMPSLTNDSVRYAGLPGRGSTDAPVTTGGAGFNTLLSYNINTDINASPSPSTPFSVETISQEGAHARTTGMPSSHQSPVSVPYAIGVRDLLRLRGHEESSFDLDLTKFRMRIITGE